MEFNRTKIAGCKVNVIFTGKNYFFLSDFFGVIGIAERNGFYDENKHKFTITAGTKYTVGGSVNRNSIIAAMKRFISKAENKYLPHKTEYVISEEICNHYLDITASKY